MRTSDSLSIRARLRISILTLVTSIVLVLSAIHVREVIGSALEQTGMRARILAETVQTCLVHTRSESQPVDGGLVKALLVRSLQRDPAVSNILVLGNRGEIVASARPWTPARLEEWPDWQSRSVLWRVRDLLRADNDIALDVESDPESHNKVRILFAPTHLRAAIRRALQEFAVLSVISLFLSGLLAVLVSRLVSNSLERLGRKIDRISAGNLASAPPEQFDPPELASLELKLGWLGRQFSGARTDIQHLRSNLDIMMRQLNEAMLVFGADGRLQVAGEPALRLLAKPREDVMGKTISEVFPQWTGPGAVLNRTAGSRQRLREVPVTLDRANLPSARLLMTVEPVAYGDDASAGVLVAFREAAAGSKSPADADFASKLLAISRITSGVAHEIKNPLNAMMLHLQIAQDKITRAADMRPELEIVQRELLRLDRVVKILLDFHRPVEPVLTSIDLHEITAEVADLVRPHAQAHKVRVVIEDSVQDARVLADVDLLRQGLLNIAVNGVEAMQSGGVLRFSVEQSGKEYSVVVRDEGTGIPADIRDRIFNLYFTTKKSATGVGLAMTYRIMMLHSGTVTVDTEVGKGTCFRLSLPAHASEEVLAAG